MNTAGRIARLGFQSLSRNLQKPLASGAAADARSARLPAGFSSSRGFAAGGHGHGDSVTYGGLTMHKPARWHVVLANTMTGLMWFWIFVRFYHDYETFLFGHAVHFEHEGPDDEEGGHGHGHGHH